MAATHLQDRFVEKHVSTMRRLELLPEPRLHIARHTPDGPSDAHEAAPCPWRRRTNAPDNARQMARNQSPGRARRRHIRQHPSNSQTLAKKTTDKQHSDHPRAKRSTDMQHSDHPAGIRRSANSEKPTLNKLNLNMSRRSTK